MPPTAPLIVHGRANSANVQAVMWTAAELGLSVIRHDVGHRHGGTNTPAYRAMNPMGKVPVLQDGDLTLFESAAIVRYLAARYGDAAFWPPDPAVRAPLDVWAEWVKTAFQPAILTNLFYPLIFEGGRDPDAAERGAKAVLPLATILSDRIGAGPWMAGETFTFADIAAGHMLYRYFTLPFPRQPLPGLSAYYDRLQDRPAFRDHVMVPYDDLKPDA